MVRKLKDIVAKKGSKSKPIIEAGILNEFMEMSKKIKIDKNSITDQEKEDMIRKISSNSEDVFNIQTDSSTFISEEINPVSKFGGAPTNVPVVPYGQPGDRAGNLDNDTKQRVEKYKYVIRYLKQKSNIKDKLIENIVAENLALRERVSVLEHVVEKLEILADTEIEKIIQDAEINLVDELSKCFCVPTKEILWEKGDLRKG